MSTTVKALMRCTYKHEAIVDGNVPARADLYFAQADAGGDTSVDLTVVLTDPEKFGLVDIGGVVEVVVTPKEV